MLRIDKRGLDKKSNDIISDINKQEMKSPVWFWMIAGAITGLVASCIETTLEERPKVIRYKSNLERKTDGGNNLHGNSEADKRRRI